MTQSSPNITILVDTSSGWGRLIIRGIANYGLKHGPWHLLVEERGMSEPMHLRPGWNGDGIIARITDKRMYDELMASGAPIVNISGIILEGVELPRVTTDYQCAGKLALQHFLDRGFRNLAYCGAIKCHYVDRHAEAFAECAKAHHLFCDVFRSKQMRYAHWSQQREKLLDWLQALPKPVGILTWSSHMGREIINLCGETGIPIPEQVAVLSGSEDDLLCEVCRPNMSAIVTPAKQIGFAAARILDGMISKGFRQNETIMLEPLGINQRLSTDTIAIDDSAVIKAIRFIRDNACHPIQVDDVVAVTHVSRRSLERRFEIALGHSPAHEIQQSHLQLASTLLRKTSMSVADVAAASGYCSAEYMSGVFRRRMKRTPLKYRIWVRAR